MSKTNQYTYIYHCVIPNYWETYKNKDLYFPEPFEQEGFIHACRLDQLEHVRTSYYVGVPEITVLKIDTSKLIAELKIEPASGQEFPHIYGGINKSAIVEVLKLKQVV